MKHSNLSLAILVCLMGRPVQATLSSLVRIITLQKQSSNILQQNPSLLGIVCRGGESKRDCSSSTSSKRGGASISTMNSDKSQDQVEKEDPWSRIGGGAVNEKVRTHQESVSSLEDDGAFDPLRHKAHLWHALEGLSRYPNYLSRWQETDMERLEKSLEQTLEQVREQRKQVMERRRGINQLVQKVVSPGEDLTKEKRFGSLLNVPSDWGVIQQHILDPRISKAIFSSQMFREKRPSIQDVISGRIKVELDASQLQIVMEEAMFDVFAFPLFRREFTALLRDYVNELKERGTQDPGFAHLRLGLRPVDLDTVGLKWINDLVFHLVVRPIARHLFESTESSGDLDWRQGYVAAYSAVPGESKPRKQLVTHTDDAEITLNIGLGADFEGGHVEFRGLRGSREGGQLIDAWEPIEGTALIHAGRHFHDVTPITKGDRFALIMWARSWDGIRKKKCPCCWMNRRTDDSCVCGAQWN